MTKPRQAYPTDLNVTQWQLIEQLLPALAATVRPQSAMGYRPPAPEAIRVTSLAPALHETMGVTLT